MNITKLKIIEIRSSQGIYKLPHPTYIVDEGSFYRLASTYIFEKVKIKSIEHKENKWLIHMTDDDYTLIVQEK